MIDLELLNFRKPTNLCYIMEKNKSDKGSFDIENSWHNYTVVYNYLFDNIKNKHLDIFELGLGTNNPNIPSSMGINGRPGASLFGWSEYFINSKIYGADIDKDILFSNDKIKTFYCDQTNPKIIHEMWNNEELKNIQFDIIIEDGLHDFDANVIFFENSIHKLKKYGYYIIEDIYLHIDIINKYQQKINEWEKIFHDLCFQLLSIPSTKNTIDNGLLIVYKK